MKIQNTLTSLLLSGSLLLALASCSSSGSGSAGTSGGNSGSVSETDLSSLVAGETLQDPESESEKATGDFTLSSSDGTVSGENGVYTISSAGEYTASGVLEEGRILIEAGEEDEVVLILSGASITNSSAAPIAVISAGEATVKSEEGTYNTVSDLRTGSVSGEEEEENAAIWSDADLHLTGKGTLIVTSTYDNGVKSKDDLVIKNVTLKVTSPGVALKGNDSVTVKSGNLIGISTGADGIKTKNSDVSDKGNQRGTVSILSGQVDIYAADDGISAAYNVEITGEEGSTVLNVTTGSLSSYTAAGDASSEKGIKAENAVLIEAGTVSVKSADDGVHANGGEALENGETSTGNVTVSGGTVIVSSGDDGIHADGELTVSGGTVKIADSHEGLEGNVVTIAGGETFVSADDDGVNASSGASAPLINVTGGYLEVETPSGDTDGLDSNGNVTVSGGFVLVKGGAQMGGMAGSVDANGSITVSGGTVVALGGVAQTPGNGSVTTYITGNQSLAAGSYTIENAAGESVISFTLNGTYSFGWVSSDLLTVGESYVLKRDGTEVLAWTQSEAITGSAGMGGFGGMNMGPGGFGGQAPGGNAGDKGGRGQSGGRGGRP